jgi:hypothetical protein
MDDVYRKAARLRDKMQVDLIRLENGFSTFGALRMDGRLFCFTLELPDLNNTPNKSRIPAGAYKCARVVSPRFGDTFEVKSVPNRSHILFHPGNSVRDTEGCILLGGTIGKLRGERAVLNSGMTFQGFMNALASYEEFDLVITEVFA